LDELETRYSYEDLILWRKLAIASNKRDHDIKKEKFKPDKKVKVTDKKDKK